MSQVRKLLQGNGGIPKTYNLVLDGQTFTINDDQLTQINNEIASLDPRYRAYLGGVSGTIASGAFVGSRPENKISAQALSNLSDKEMEFLKAGKQNLWEAITDNNTYRAKEAINEALNIISRVVGSKKQKESTTEQTPDKKIAYNREAKFDYNLDKDGNYVYSSNPINSFIESRFPSYLDWLSNDKWGDANKWETPLGDNEAILRGWYSGLGSREAAEAAINNALNEVKTKPWDKVSEETKELLKYFNITNATMGGGSGSSSGSGGIYNEDGTVNQNARTDTGGFFIYKGSQASGQDPNGWYTNYNVNSTSVPYLITENDWTQLGIDATSPYAHGIIYNGRLYTEDEVNKYPGSELYAIMKRVADINANTKIIGKEKYNALRSLINWYGSSNDYAYYDYDPDSVFVKNKMLRERLGNNKYSLFDASRFYGYNHPSELIGYYDYSATSDLPWGFRSPKFIEGNLDNNTYTPKTDIEGMTYNPYVTPDVFEGDKYFAPWVEIKDKRLGTKRYGIYTTIHNTVSRQDTDVYFDYDDEGNVRLWVKKGDNKLIPVSEKFRDEIDAGRKNFTGKEITEGKVYIDGKYLKEGGKVDYIAKLQAGFVVPPSKPVSAETISPGNNVEEGHIFDENGDFDWNSLPGADKKELTAMALDLSGAIAGWFGPWGSVGGAVAGLAGTGFNTAADIERGRGFWGTAGSTVLNAGLDVVSAIPELGEIAQIAKLGKTVERISKNAKLINWIGKAFNVYGLGAAWEPFKKVLNGGFKDLTTDEAYALANGLRVIMSGTRTKLQHRGDAQLAEAIAKERGNQKLNTPQYQKVMQVSPEINTKFTETDIADIHNAGENAGKVLRSKLKAIGADESKLEVSDESLLTRFGFTVTKDGSGKITGVTSPEGYTLDTHNRSVARVNAGQNEPIKLKEEEVETILAGNEDAGNRLRNILKNNYGVDPSKINTDDVKLLKEFGFGARKAHTGKNKGKITHVYRQGWSASAESKIKPDEAYSKYGYLTDLLNGSSKRMAFIDQNMRGPNNEGGPVRDAIDQLMRSTGSDAPSRAMQRAYARSQYRINELPLRSGNSRFMPNLDEETRVNRNETPASSPKSLETVTQQHTQTAQNTQTTNSSAQPVQDTKKPKSQFNFEVSLEEEKAQAAKASSKTANLIEKLKSSKDPMKTLSEVMDAEESIESDQILMNFARTFKSLNNDQKRQLMRHPNFKKFLDVINGKAYNSWIDKKPIDEIDQLFRTNKGFKEFVQEHPDAYSRISIKRSASKKQGGVIKAQAGGIIHWEWWDNNGVRHVEDQRVPYDFSPEQLEEEVRRRTPDTINMDWEKNRGYRRMPKYTIVRDPNPTNKVEQTENKPIQVVQGSYEPLLLPNTFGSYGFNVDHEVAPYQAFAYSNLGQNNISDVVESTSKPTEQKIVKVKTNKQKDFSDLVTVLENLLDKRKNGGVIKAQTGLKFDPNWKVPGWQIEESTPSWKQGSLYLEGTEPKVGYNTTVPGVLGMNDFDVTNGVSLADIVTGRKTSADIQSKKVKRDLAGGYDDNISDKTKWINPLISTFRYGLNAWAQRKYTDQAIKAINAGRYNELPVWQNLPVMTNPTLDRQLQQVHLERMAGMKPVTSDLIANNALWNQRESQLYDRENDIYGKQSAFQWDAAREGLNIMNQNLANQVKVANENKARSAALNSAIEQQKMAFIQMLNQSRQNALLEVQNNVMNDRKTMLAYEQNQYNQQLQRDYDSYLRRTYGDAAYNYSKLNYAERSKYTDLEDYILRNVPGSAEDISTKRSEILNNQLRWNRDNALNYNYGFLAGKTSRVGNRTFKKGGRVNGTTRYTLDPDERIWVDNNKAAHAGVAKLTDNVIKLILRALK